MAPRSLSLAVALPALLAVSALIADPAAAAAQSPTSDPEVRAQIDLFSAWLEGQIAIRGLPGIVVGVVSGDDLVWAEAFGHADVASGRPMAIDTRFRMASHSKLFTATAIMQLREQGMVRLDRSRLGVPAVVHIPNRIAR